MSYDFLSSNNSLKYSLYISTIVRAKFYSKKMAALRNVVTGLFVLSISVVYNIECNKNAWLNPDDPNLYSNIYDNGIDLLENRIAKETIKTFLLDVKDILDNDVAGDIITGISATFKLVFTDEIGHQTVIALAKGITKILKDENTKKSIEAFVTGVEMILGNKNALELFKMEYQAFNEIIDLDQTPKVIQVIGEGFKRILNHDDIDQAIERAFGHLIKLSQAAAKN